MRITLLLSVSIIRVYRLYILCVSCSVYRSLTIYSYCAYRSIIYVYRSCYVIYVCHSFYRPYCICVCCSCTICVYRSVCRSSIINVYCVYRSGIIYTYRPYTICVYYFLKRPSFICVSFLFYMCLSLCLPLFNHVWLSCLPLVYYLRVSLFGVCTRVPVYRALLLYIPATINQGLVHTRSDGSVSLPHTTLLNTYIYIHTIHRYIS